MEERNFQLDLEELKSEWIRESNEGRDIEELIRQVKGYHVRRVAYFVKNRWDYPIVIGAEGTIKDGSHRIRAAIFKDMEELEVVVEI